MCFAELYWIHCMIDDGWCARNVCESTYTCLLLLLWGGGGGEEDTCFAYVTKRCWRRKLGHFIDVVWMACETHFHTMGVKSLFGCTMPKNRQQYEPVFNLHLYKYFTLVRANLKLSHVNQRICQLLFESVPLIKRRHFGPEKLPVVNYSWKSPSTHHF